MFDNNCVKKTNKLLHVFCGICCQYIRIYIYTIYLGKFKKITL